MTPAEELLHLHDLFARHVALVSATAQAVGWEAAVHALRAAVGPLHAFAFDGHAEGR